MKDTLLDKLDHVRDLQKEAQNHVSAAVDYWEDAERRVDDIREVVSEIENLVKENL